MPNPAKLLGMAVWYSFMLKIHLFVSLKTPTSAQTDCGAHILSTSQLLFFCTYVIKQWPFSMLWRQYFYNNQEAVAQSPYCVPLLALTSSPSSTACVRVMLFVTENICPWYGTEEKPVGALLEHQRALHSSRTESLLNPDLNSFLLFIVACLFLTNLL